jgi:GT2 family glycosyltransferase
MTQVVPDTGQRGSPSLAVIIPVWRHWDRVGPLLEALRAAGAVDGVDDVEVILCDNAGHDEIAGPSHLPGVRIVRCFEPGSYAARNVGAALAQSEWLVFTDADCLPQPGWIDGYRRAIAAGTGRLLAGPIEMQAGPRPGFVESYDFVRGIPQERYVARGFAATANLAVETTLFQSLGGFDAKRFSGGDADFSRRAAKVGSPVRLVAAARVGHPSRTEWGEVLSKARRVWGGRVLHGTPRRRILWFLGCLIPPFHKSARLAGVNAPLAMRAKAQVVVWVVWAVEIAEMVRLGLGGQPERR